MAITWIDVFNVIGIVFVVIISLITVLRIHKYNTEERIAKERGDVLDKLEHHIKIASEKHPLLGVKDVAFGDMLCVKEHAKTLKRMRDINDICEKERLISWSFVLREELEEFELEYATGNKDRAIDELYDIMTVAARAVMSVSKISVKEQEDDEEAVEL